MYKLFSFLVISSLISVTLYLHNKNGHYLVDSHPHSDHLLKIPEDETLVPAINGSLQQDPTGTWLLKLETNNFQFTPEKIGESQTGYYEGHAHLYINDKKMNRLYGHYYNINVLEPGAYTIKVTLNANNHAVLTYKNKPIAYHETIVIPR
jgi:hypothetical protein